MKLALAKPSRAAAKSKAKQILLPNKPAIRRLPFGPARGLRMEIDFAHQTGLYLGLYECELNRHITRFCRRGYNSFDIGGNIGYDALLFARLTSGKVITFECDLAAIRVMERNLNANSRIGSNIQIEQAFVSDASDASSGRLSLDDVAYSERGFVPDIIKMDIEGDELNALRGAHRLLSERRPHAIIEVHSMELERECDDLLRRHRYEPRIVDARRWLKENRTLPHNRWLVAEGRQRRG